MLRRALPVSALLLALATAAQGQSRAQRTEAYLEAFHDLGRFNGAALVIDRGEVLFEGAFGFSAAEGEIPAEVSTRFRIASLTKQFTAALILRLEEEGLLRVDAPVHDYIPEYPSPNGERITLHHLLTHTSGLPSYTDLPDFMERRVAEPISPAEIIALTWDEPLRFEPGTDFEYSNSGYVLLGWIVERVTGASYDQALRDHVLATLELADTGYDHGTTPATGHARGYTRTLVGYEPARAIDPSVPFSAGMLYSTIGDLRRWAYALLGWDEAATPFLDSLSAPRMLTPDREAYGYGLGIRTRDIGRETGVRVVEHTGGIFGFTSILRAFPEHERLIVLLDNTSSDLRPIAEGLTNLMWGAEAVLPKASIAERLLSIVETAGVEAAMTRYESFRRTRPDEYDYSPGELIRLAEHFHASDPTISIGILEARAEEMPETPLTRFALFELYIEQGDTASAIGHLEAALSYNPGLPQLLAPLAELGAETDPVLLLPVVDVDVERLAALTGEYRVDPATTLEVVLEGDELLASRTGEPAFRLLPQSPTVFLLHGSRVQLVFEMDGESASGVSIIEAGQRVTFPRIEGR